MRATIARTKASLAAEVISRLDTSYELVYVSNDDRLTAEQTSALVRGDWEKVWDSIEEWESDQKFDAATEIIRELTTAVVAEWESDDDADHQQLADDFPQSDEWDEVRYAIEERDAGDWMRALVEQTPTPVLRVMALDEDDAFSFEPVDGAQVFGRLGFPDTDQNRRTLQYVLDNASPEFSTLMGFWVFSVDLGALYDLPDDVEEIVVTDPHLYLGNPMAGTGFVSEEPLRGEVHLQRADLRTDADAFGYSLSSIYGGLTPGEFAAALRKA